MSLSIHDDTDRAKLPKAGRWTIDAAHTTIGFWVRHLGVAKVRGAFRSFAGTVEIAELPERSSISVTIDAASIDTREPSRDDHLRSPEFLDVDHHPALTFTSTAVRGSGSRWVVDGHLTVRGVTRPVVLDVEFHGMRHDGDTARSFFTATTSFDRTRFGLTWNQVVEGGGVLVGRDVHIELDVELTTSL